MATGSKSEISDDDRSEFNLYQDKVQQVQADAKDETIAKMVERTEPDPLPVEGIRRSVDEIRRSIDEIRSSVDDIRRTVDSLLQFNMDKDIAVAEAKQLDERGDEFLHGKAYNILVVGASESEDKAYKVFLEMSKPNLEENLLGIEGTNAARYMFDKMPKPALIQESVDEDLKGEGMVNGSANGSFKAGTEEVTPSLNIVLAKNVMEIAALKVLDKLAEPIQPMPIDEQQLEASLYTTSFEVTVKKKMNDDRKLAITTKNLVVEMLQDDERLELQKNYGSIFGAEVARYLLDERPNLPPVDSNANLYGNKVPLSSIPYILHICRDDDRGTWFFGLLTNLLMFTTQDLSSEDDVLGINLSIFQSLSNMEFIPQVFDPGTGAICSMGLFTLENKVEIEFEKWHSGGINSNVYGRFMFYNYLVAENCGLSLLHTGLDTLRHGKIELGVLLSELKHLKHYFSSNGYDGVIVAKLQNFVWDSGGNVITFYILEDKDVFKRVGKDIVLMDTILEITVDSKALRKSNVRLLKRNMVEMNLKFCKGSRLVLVNGLILSSLFLVIKEAELQDCNQTALAGLGPLLQMVPIGVIKVNFQTFVWDPGLDCVSFRFSTLRTRCSFRGGICHDMTLFYNFICIFVFSYFTSYDVIY